MIRDAESLEVLSISQCVEHIDRVEWSRDGDHVLCAQYRVGVVQCFSVSNDAWTCKIDEAAAGCVYARWTPCGTQIITVAEFNVRATAWSLVDRSCVVLDAPKLASADGFSFSPRREVPRVRAQGGVRGLREGGIDENVDDGGGLPRRDKVRSPYTGPHTTPSAW